MKDYFPWHSLKTAVNEKVRPGFQNRDIWFCTLGVNVGFEQDGKGENYLRPVVIVRKFSNEVCLAIPLTRSKKTGIHYFSLTPSDDGLTSTAILSQIRLIDSKRLNYKSGTISEIDFVRLKEKLKRLIA